MFSTRAASRVCWSLKSTIRIGTCARSTFAGDELELTVDVSAHERLEDAVLADAGAEGGELILVEVLSRLIRVLDDLPDRDLGRFAAAAAARCGNRLGRVAAAEQGIETSTQTWLVH